MKMEFINLSDPGQFKSWFSRYEEQNQIHDFYHGKVNEVYYIDKLMTYRLREIKDPSVQQNEFSGIDLVCVHPDGEMQEMINKILNPVSTETKSKYFLYVCPDKESYDRYISRGNEIRTHPDYNEKYDQLGWEIVEETFTKQEIPAEHYYWFELMQEAFAYVRYPRFKTYEKLVEAKPEIKTGLYCSQDIERIDVGKTCFNSFPCHHHILLTMTDGKVMRCNDLEAYLIYQLEMMINGECSSHFEYMKNYLSDRGFIRNSQFAI